jgi:holin-like protein
MHRLHHAARLALGFGILVAVLELGNLASSWVPLPGPLVGMILLVGFLSLPQNAVARAVVACGEFLLKHYAFFFVPAGVGVMVHVAQLRADWFALIASLVVSSLVALVVTAAAMQFLIRRRGNDAAG